MPARAGASERFAAAATPTAAPWTLPVALLAGVLAAVVVGAALALATARLRGPYLAGLTLAFGLDVLPVTVLVDALRGEQGLPVHVPRVPAGLYGVGETRWRAWVVLVAAVVVLVLVSRVMRGRPGRDIRAVRDDEVAAALAGISVARTRVGAFVLSAAAAGLAGGGYVYLTGTVLPGYFGLTVSLYLLVAVVLGGGGLAGTAAGTAFVIAVPIATAEVVAALDVSPPVAIRLAGNAPLALLGLALVAATLARSRWSVPGHRRPYAAYENGPSNPREDGVRTP